MHDHKYVLWRLKDGAFVNLLKAAGYVLGPKRRAHSHLGEVLALGKPMGGLSLAPRRPSCPLPRPASDGCGPTCQLG